MRSKLCLTKIPDSAVNRSRILLVAQALEVPTARPVLFAFASVLSRLATFQRANGKKKERPDEPGAESAGLLTRIQRPREESRSTKRQ